MDEIRVFVCVECESVDQLEAYEFKEYITKHSGHRIVIVSGVDYEALETSLRILIAAVKKVHCSKSERVED